MDVVIDIQGFRGSDKQFIVKELAALSVDNTLRAHWMFLPPTHWNQLSNDAKKQAQWLTNHHHQLGWEDGNIPYYKLACILQSVSSLASTITVKGEEIGRAHV